MYKIEAGGNVIWAPTLANLNYEIINPTLIIEKNKASTLELTVPNSNARKNIITLLTPEVKVYDGETRIFRGRVLNTEKDMQRSRKIHAEGDLSYLRDVIVRPDWKNSETGDLNYYSTRWFLQSMIRKYNAIATTRQFEEGNIWNVDLEAAGETPIMLSDQYPDLLSELTDKLLNRFGGIIQTRCAVVGGVEKTYIDYLEASENDIAESETISYGKNLLDFSENADATPICTRVIPLGATVDNERITIGTPDYVNNPAKEAQYGVIETVVTHDDITEQEQLRTAGEADLGKAINAKTSIELNAVDMSFFGEGGNRLTVGKVYNINYGKSETTTARLVRAELKLAAPGKSRYVFGNTKVGASNEVVNTNRVMDQVVNLALQNKANTTEVADKVNAIADYIEIKGSEGNIKYRKWKSGTYDVYGRVTATWGTWTTANGISTATTLDAIELPAVLSSITAQNYHLVCTPLGTTPMALSITKGTGSFTLSAVCFAATPPATTDVEILFYT